MRPPSQPAPRVPAPDIRRPAWQRALAGLLAALLAAPAPQAWAQVAGSNLSPDPQFVRAIVQPNVAFLMDDSASMRLSTLPRDPSIGAWEGPANRNFALRATEARRTDYYRNRAVIPGTPVQEGMAERNVSINRDQELALRAAALNPLWYNPAVTYAPWDDNGKPAATNFPPAATGGTGVAPDGARLTRRDMRYRLNGSTRVQLSTATGTVGDRNNPWDGANSSGWSTSVPAAGAQPAGNMTHDPIPHEGPRGRDLFTTYQDRWQVDDTSVVVTPGTQSGCYRPGLPPTRVGGMICTAYNTAREARTYVQEWRCDWVAQAGTESGGYNNCRWVNTPTVSSWWEPGTRCVANGCGEGTYWFGGTNPTYGAKFAAPVTFLPAARYFVFTGPTPNQRNNFLFYELVTIDRGRSRDYSDPANRYVVRDAVTGAAAKRDDCTTSGDGSWCTFEEEAQNFANWYAYYRLRLFAAIAVASQALSALAAPNDQIRLGYGRINNFAGAGDPFRPTVELPVSPATLDGETNAGALVRGVRDFVKSATNVDRQAFFDWLFTLHWNSATPNREAYDAVGRYFARSDMKGPWADYPGLGGGREAAQHLGCRRNFTMLATDGEWTRVDPPITPRAQPLLESSAGGNPLNSGTSTALTADGAGGPTIVGDGPNAGVTFTYAPGSFPQFTGGSSAQEGTLSDATMFYWNRDLRPDVKNLLRPIPGNPAFWQHVTPLIIGYGLIASMDTPANRAAIEAGGAVAWPSVGLEQTRVTDVQNGMPFGNRVNDTMRAAYNGRGNFYTASDAEQLRTSIEAAFAAVNSQTSAGTALATTSTLVTTDDRIFAAKFTTGRWTGELMSYDAVPLFDAIAAGAGLPAPRWHASIGTDWAARNVLTSRSANQAIAFRNHDDLTSAQKTGVGSQENIDWLRGDRSKEGAGLRVRASLLGDIVNSSPVFSKGQDYGYGAGPSAGGGGSYRTHLEFKAASRRPAVLVGANAGMFHGFDANDGRELFAYVPRGAYENLHLLPRPGYRHRYYVDGQTAQGDAFIGGGWKTVAVGSTGAGGRGLFALDVTRPESVSTASVLWDVTQAEIPQLGSVLGAGVVASMKTGEWAYVVGNGYESSDGRAYLLVIDLRDGSLIRAIPTDTETDNGLGPITPVFDANRNLIAAYAGDKRGRLWRFDLSATTSATWEAPASRRALIRAESPSGGRQPITAAPRLLPHPLGGTLVTFGTGKFFELDDPMDTRVQSLYAVWERSGASGTLVRGDLRQLNVGSGATRDITGAPLNWRTQSGWYIDLPAGSERVIASPSVTGGLVNYTSYVPNANADPCEGGGGSYVYSMDPLKGIGGGRVAPTALLGGSMMLRKAAAPRPNANETSKSDLVSMMAGRFDAAGGLTAAGRAARKANSPWIYAGSGNASGNAAGGDADGPDIAIRRIWREGLQ